MELTDRKAPLRVEFSCSVHATESEEKVMRALQNVLPEHLRESGRVLITKSRVRGYYGNQILIISASVSGFDAQEALNYLLEKLSDEDKAHLSATLKARLQGGKLYLRLSKQKAFAGILRLSESDDVIRVIVSLKRK